MTDYYMIPITSKQVRVEGISLSEILKELSPELAERDEIRKKITYETPEKPKELEEFNKQTHELYKKRGIIEKIVVLKEDDLFRELYTRIPIECDNSMYLEVFKTEMKDVSEFILNTEYFEQVNNFINKSKEMKNNLEKTK